ncbi:MAG: hypothetical protein KDK39_06385 [Leptospiraceae bacterium]|nr:hypothetical protein [Leptospiraceae bacterium]
MFEELKHKTPFDLLSMLDIFSGIGEESSKLLQKNIQFEYLIGRLNSDKQQNCQLAQEAQLTLRREAYINVEARAYDYFGNYNIINNRFYYKSPSRP